MVEQEPRFRVALLQGAGGFPAHVTENVAGTRSLDDRDVGAVDQRVQRRGRLRVTRISEDPIAELDPVAVAAGRTVVELDGLVLVTRHLAPLAGGYVSGLKARQHHGLPVDAPADLEQSLQPLVDAVRSDKGDRSRLVDEDAEEDEWRKPECVITVKVRQEDGVDVDGLDAEALQRRERRRAG